MGVEAFSRLTTGGISHKSCSARPCCVFSPTGIPAMEGN